MKLVGKVKSGMNSLSYWMNKLEPFYTAKTGNSHIGSSSVPGLISKPTVDNGL